MTAQPLNIRNYSEDLQPEILDALHAGFGRRWGTGEWWRWKHLHRPGFQPADVTVFKLTDQCGACFHVSVRTLCLGRGVEVSSSMEGDFVVQPPLRGRGLTSRYFEITAPLLAQRGVALRGGFSSPDLHKRLYNPKFGHCLINTVNAHYRKVLSDAALRAKAQEFGKGVCAYRLARRLLEQGPVIVRMEITGFAPCDLVLERGTCVCVGQSTRHADVVLRAPYLVLTAARMRPLNAFMTIGRALVSGKVRVRGVMRFAVRCLGAVMRSSRS